LDQTRRLGPYGGPQNQQRDRPSVVGEEIGQKPHHCGNGGWPGKDKLEDRLSSSELNRGSASHRSTDYHRLISLNFFHSLPPRRGTDQHGVATATACALLGLECVVYMGAVDIQRQALNVFRMKTLGATVVGVSSAFQVQVLYSAVPCSVLIPH